MPSALHVKPSVASLIVLLLLSFSSQLLVLGDVIPVNSDQYRSLLTLYRGWRLRTNSWNPRDCDSLKPSGVTCDFRGRVVEIDISGRFANGTIHGDIYGLRSLTRLDLSNNILQGTVPKTLAFLSQLRELDLSRNLLTDILASNFFTSLKFLTRIDLSRNQLSGFIPKSLCELPMESLIDLSNNRFCGPLPCPFYPFLQFKVANNFLSGPPVIQKGFGDVCPETYDNNCFDPSTTCPATYKGYGTCVARSRTCGMTCNTFRRTLCPNVTYGCPQFAKCYNNVWSCRGFRCVCNFRYFASEVDRDGNPLACSLRRRVPLANAIGTSI